MFAVIYQCHVYKGEEETFQKLWHQIAKYFIEHRGAEGSCLHQTLDGGWIAYSRWPNKEMRDASWPKEGEEPSGTLGIEMVSVISNFKKCIDRNKPSQEHCMEVKDDLLLRRN